MIDAIHINTSEDVGSFRTLCGITFERGIQHGETLFSANVAWLGSYNHSCVDCLSVLPIYLLTK